MILETRSSISILPTILLMGVFLLLSFSCIQYIGLTYDETMFIKGVLPGQGESIFKLFFGYPLMVTADQGAIKSYLFYPIFKLFGINVFSIRLPVIFIATITLFIWYKISERIFSTKLYSLLFLTLLALDPVYIFHTRVDFGPIALQALFATLAIYFYLMYLAKASLKFLSLFLTVMLLGILNKINFLQFALSFIFVAFLYDGMRIFKIFNRRVFASSAMICLFSAVLALIIFYLIIPPALHYPMGGMTKIPLLKKIPFVFQLYRDTFNSSFRYEQIFHRHLNLADVTCLIEITAIGIVLLSLAWLRLFKIENPTVERYLPFFKFYLMLFILQFLFVLFTPHTFATNHMMLLWPLNHLLFVLALAILIALAKKTWKLAVIGLAILSTVFLSQLYVNFEYFAAFKDPFSYRTYVWSTVIYDLSHYVSEHCTEYDNVLSNVIGPHTPLLALSKNAYDRKKLYETWPLFTNYPLIQASIRMYPLFNHDAVTNQQRLFDKYFAGKKNLVITFTNGEVFHGEKSGLFEFAAKYAIQLTPVKTLNAGDGTSVYTLYSAVSPSVQGGGT
jgi:Dolichyl-phosphate-mannose-protein mannosyltransferase